MQTGNYFTTSKLTATNQLARVCSRAFARDRAHYPVRCAREHYWNICIFDFISKLE